MRQDYALVDFSCGSWFLFFPLGDEEAEGMKGARRARGSKGKALLFARSHLIGWRFSGLFLFLFPVWFFFPVWLSCSFFFFFFSRATLVQQRCFSLSLVPLVCFFCSFSLFISWLSFFPFFRVAIVSGCGRWEQKPGVARASKHRERSRRGHTPQVRKRPRENRSASLSECLNRRSRASPKHPVVREPASERARRKRPS